MTDRRELDSRDDAGLVTIDATTTNQDDEVLFEGDMKFLFKRRDHYGEAPGSP